MKRILIVWYIGYDLVWLGWSNGFVQVWSLQPMYYIFINFWKIKYLLCERHFLLRILKALFLPFLHTKTQVFIIVDIKPFSMYHYYVLQDTTLYMCHQQVNLSHCSS